MQTIFEREFRREKNLEVAKRQGEKKGPAKDKKNDKIAERLEAQLKDIEDKFFEQFPVEEEQRFDGTQEEAKQENAGEQ